LSAGMVYRIAIDGDSMEQAAWRMFLEAEFPAYELFWLKNVVPLTHRPRNIHFLDDAALAASGRSAEDIAIAQLHYTVLRHLVSAFLQRTSQHIDEHGLFVGLSRLCGAQDVAFELLQRHTNRGRYGPWLEARQKGGLPSGQDAQSDWKRSNSYPLQDIRDYRNKLMHGRTPPALVDPRGLKLPAMRKVDQYCDWRLITGPGSASNLSDFDLASSLLDSSWRSTIGYLEASWRQHLL
jgi:hypothetical protein